MSQRGPKGRPADRAPRRRGRELALQVLFSLDMTRPESVQGVRVALNRGRERATLADAELAFADGDLERASAATAALLRLDGRHPRGLEFQAALARKGPMPLPQSADDRDELEALAASEEALELCDTLTLGVMEGLGDLDALISEVSTNWRVARMAHVDRNILRIATFELQSMPETPTRVVLNEAIEIAKRFGTRDSGAFVNGVLDRLAVRLRPPKAEAVESPS